MDPDPVSDDPVSDDPVLIRRARMAGLAAQGKRFGYGLLLAAIVLFVAGAATGFTPLIVRLFVAAMAVSSLLLAPAIVLGYAVGAADREDRERR